VIQAIEARTDITLLNIVSSTEDSIDPKETQADNPGVATTASGDGVEDRRDQSQEPSLDDLLTAADIYVGHSVRRARTSSSVRATALGLPIVTIEDQATAEVVQSGVGAETASSFDARAMAGKLAPMLVDESLRRRLGRMNRAWFESRSSAEYLLEQWRSLFIEAAEWGGESEDVLNVESTGDFVRPTGVYDAATN
jgi:hypothetical protein